MSRLKSSIPKETVPFETSEIGGAAETCDGKDSGLVEIKLLGSESAFLALILSRFYPRNNFRATKRDSRRISSSETFGNVSGLERFAK